MASSLPFCTVCRARYRGGSTVHAGTERHRRLVRGPKDSYIRRLKPKRSYRAPREYDGSDHVKVRKHRRRRPNDGPRRTVKVTSYWRFLQPYRRRRAA